MFQVRYYICKLAFACLMLLICLSQSFGQGRTIEGIVTDQDNIPLLGVTVRIDGTSQGGVTGVNGNFSILASEGQTLVFSMISMQTQRVVVGKETVLNIKLLEETELLDEIVVDGFRKTDRNLFTGASEKLRMSEIQSGSIVDVSRALEGQVAGVNVDNVSGTFGTAPKIRIRGNASINGNNQPLLVVDGVILEDLTNVNTDDFISGNASTLVGSSIANLNPDDIESFQILKDASATAIYGARAANGVIVITTKRGKSGRLRISYTGNYSAKLRPTYNQFNLLNSEEEMSVYRELVDKGLIDISTAVRAQTYGAMGKMFVEINRKNVDWGPGGSLNEEFLNQYENANTDWFDVLFNDLGIQQQHSLSFSSGTEKSNSYYSVSYLNDQGQTISDKVQRLTASARNTYFISKKFTFGLKLSASYRDQPVPGTRNREFDPTTGTYSRGFDVNPLSFALNTSRSQRPYDENGEPEYFRRNFAPFNILEELDYNFININVLDASTQTDFEITPSKNLSIKGVFQLRYANTERNHTVHERSNQAEAYRAADTQFIQDANNLLFSDPDNPGLNPVSVLPQGGFNYLDKTDLLNVFSRLSVEWSKKWKEDHQFNVLAGQELRFTDRTENSSTALGVIYESGGVTVTDPNIIEFFNLQNINVNSQGLERDRFLGFFLNGAYAYKGKYIGNFTVRYDGSNQLGRSQNAKYLPTWNVSGAWNAHSESFMENLTFLDELKIRATYGVSGNLPPEASALLNIQSDVTVRPTDVEPVLIIQDLTNNDLTWEKLKELNVGMDFSVFDGKISGTADLYSRQSFDLIGILLTSGVGGQGLKVGNFADMESQGFELSLATVNYSKNNFSWSTNFNIGYTKDEVTDLDFGPRRVDAINQTGAAVLGGPRRGLYSARFAGLNSFGVPTFLDENDETVFEYELQSRENLDEILQYEGPTEARGGGGLTNTFVYKNFKLSVLLSYKFDYKIRLNDAFRAEYNDFTALPGELANRWVVPGDEELTNVPVILDKQTVNSNSDELLAYSLYNQSTIRVADGDYIRLRNVRVSYSLPKTILDKFGMTSASLSLEGQNLALLYSDKKLNGQDPEFFSTGGVSLPQPKMITFSLNIGL